MDRGKKVPVAVTIAGSDSGGGAGIQADLKTFAALEVHGLCVITNITAQSPKAVRAIEPCSARIIRQQLAAIYEDFRPAATKVGVLYTAEIIRSVARFLRQVKAQNVVIDPVMISTSGRDLLQPAALKVLRDKLFPLAAVITPNVPEAEKLLGKRLKDVDALGPAARELHGQFGCAILIKGGHLRWTKAAVDVVFDGERETVVTAPRMARVKTHGTGCTYSSAIAAFLARGCPLDVSIRKAKKYVTATISRTVNASGHPVLSWQ